MEEFKPPNQIKIRPARKSVFLAGTIDNGDSENWQSGLAFKLSDYDIDIYNPRREEWDPTWKQDFENPQFYQQVNWELDALEKADYIIVNILPNSKSPITLMEMGIHIRSGKLLVVCPKEFYRSGNVHITCDRYKVPVFENINEMINTLKTLI